MDTNSEAAVIKPYVSKCKGQWEVLDARGRVAFHSRVYSTAHAWWTENYASLLAA